MVGGEIVQVLSGVGYCVEVLDTTYFDRQWRYLPNATDVHIGDTLWWQNSKGYLSRDDDSERFTDRPIGECKPSENPLMVPEIK